MKCHEWHGPQEMGVEPDLGNYNKHFSTWIDIQVTPKYKKGCPPTCIMEECGGTGCSEVWTVGAQQPSATPNEIPFTFAWTCGLVGAWKCRMSLGNWLDATMLKVHLHLHHHFVFRCSNWLSLACANSPNYVSIILIFFGSCLMLRAAIIFLVVTQDLVPFFLAGQIVQQHSRATSHRWPVPKT